MELAVHYPNFTMPGDAAAIASTLRATAQAAEAAGCAQFTVMDHYFQMEAFLPATDPMLEGYTTLGYLAGVTSKIRLGLLVTGVTYRYPGLLAKIVTTLDILSGGRAQLGIGAAWYEKEALGLGVPFPSTSERFERLEETLQICKQMWSNDDGPFEGRHYQLAETLCRPQPIQRPGPSILIGGSGEKKTLRLVAQYADACNLFDSGVEGLTHKLEVLRGHCDAVGRDYDEVQKTVIWGSAETLEDYEGFVATMADYSKLGISQIWVSAPAPDPAGWVTDFAASVVPRLADLS